MQVLFIFILFTITDAKRVPYDSPIQSNYKAFNHPKSNKQSETFQRGLDFGHVYRKGFRDSSYSQQFDLETDMVQPDRESVRELNQNSHNNMKPNLKDQPLVFLSPRDEMLYHKKYNKSFIQTQLSVAKEMDNSNDPLKTVTRPSWYDFAQLLERNLAYPLAARRRKLYETKDDRKINQVYNKVQNVNFSNYFEDNTFLKKSNRNNHKLKWTTCDEFEKRAVFHPDDVINTKWLPFYIWSTRGFTSSIIHTFSYPTKKIVQRFKTKYEPYIKKINWNEPKLLLRERKEILLIAGDRRGLFYEVPWQELPSYIEGKNLTLPILKLRMKIHDPYLAMMYCDDNYAIIMAELGTEPHSDEDKTLEASTLKFKGIGKPAHRDLETELLLARLEKKKKIEAESRRIIPIEIPNVDLQVRHRLN